MNFSFIFLENTSKMCRSIMIFTTVVLALLASTIIAQEDQSTMDNGGNTGSTEQYSDTNGSGATMAGTTDRGMAGEYTTGMTGEPGTGMTGEFTFPMTGEPTGPMTGEPTGPMTGEPTGGPVTDAPFTETEGETTVVMTTVKMTTRTTTMMMTTIPTSTARPTVAMTTTTKNNHGVTVHPCHYLLALFISLLLIV